ncbi:SPOR domain-containing protein [Paracoccus sp. DMF-8]|uniref:SPOR domain-containing protein n=1 Tax=Paracoccus sp. DMF-8 TaxID=3019445 RepID=UPI0023E850EC|nr:SPOR domain-containing protein [Paracoccus sp. DMF-8]MDF3605982.1 SPOR domain-containing protein [Paracoccus sp. DMF-8]
MAVVDFRSGGGFVGAQPRQVRDYPYGQDPRAEESEWAGHGHWDEERYHDDSDARYAADISVGARVGRLTHYLGAVISVGLMVMLAVWGYKLVMRDVSGVPVIRAIEGEARTAPDNPGGELVARTGLAVNAVAAGTDARPANQVAIAPEATGLGEEDVAMGELGATARQPSRETELPLEATNARIVALSDAEAAAARAEAQASAAQAQLSDAPANEGPVNEALTDLDGQQVVAPETINAVLAEAAAAAAQPTPGGLATSARPAPRPRRTAAAQPTVVSDAAPVAAPAAAPVQRVAPNAVASGAPLVQIGAFDSNALAEGGWNRISGKFGALFSGKGQVIQRAESNGRTFWRLRVAGFDSRDEARRFCAALVAEGTDCIPASAQ